MSVNAQNTPEVFRSVSLFIVHQKHSEFLSMLTKAFRTSVSAVLILLTGAISKKFTLQSFVFDVCVCMFRFLLMSGKIVDFYKFDIFQ